ncbi:hypothetical protein BDZ45DRAFT_800026 [Acephala macrosclerotiorum]|nr:hypothetical protein BDZ45DRAFT_800026 [Acephala macrosclerotiorum]
MDDPEIQERLNELASEVPTSNPSEPKSNHDQNLEEATDLFYQLTLRDVFPPPPSEPVVDVILSETDDETDRETSITPQEIVVTHNSEHAGSDDGFSVVANATDDEEQEYLREILEEIRLNETTNKPAFSISERSLSETSDEERVLFFEIGFEDLIPAPSDQVVEIILGPDGTISVQPEVAIAGLETL